MKVRDGSHSWRRWAKSATGIGMIALGFTLAVGYVMFQKDMLITNLVPGDTVRAHFAQDYRLRPYITPVKVAGVKVGRVSDVERMDDGTAMVEVKVDRGIAKKIGSAPTAAIRPTTLLAGNYYLELIPGGDHDTEFAGVIPMDRTHVPVELDQIAATLQPDAIKGVRAGTERLDATLQQGGQSAIDMLAADAPPALRPASPVLEGLSGSRPGDLTRLVHGMESTAHVLTEQHGQLDAIVRDLATTSRVLGARSEDLGAVVADLPETLDTTDAGLRRLDITLAKLRKTAGPAEDVVDSLGPLIEHTDPVLVDALPVVRNLRGVLDDALPMVKDLVPARKSATEVLDDIDGPVLDRLNGPILRTVMSTYTGTGHYEGSGDSTTPFFKELAFMFANIDRASKVTDANGANVGFQPGFGSGSIEGVPINIEQLWKNLANLPNPDENRGKR